MHKDMKKTVVEKKPTPSTKSVTLTAGKDIQGGDIFLQKVDSRDHDITLKGVGFTFSAQVQKYERGEIKKDVRKDCEHPISCSHLVSCSHPNPCTCKKGKKCPGHGYKHSDDGYAHSNDGYKHKDDHDYYLYYYDYYNTVTMYLNSNNEWVEDSSQAKVFYTNDDGIISESYSFQSRDVYNKLTNGYDGSVSDRLEPGSTITAKEVKNPYYGYKVGETWQLKPGAKEPIIVENLQHYIKSLSGFVWLDEHSGKLSMTDSEYNGEKGVNGIIVKLKDRSGNIVQKEMKDGEGNIIYVDQVTVTSEVYENDTSKDLYPEISGGEYAFEDVNLDELEAGNYHIEFEYCGIEYQSVNPKLDSAKGSKAVDSYSRSILDNQFSSVNGNGSQSLNVDGVILKYGLNSQYKSTIKEHGDYTDARYVKYQDIEEHSNCTVYASTQEAGYDLYDDFVPSSSEIKYVNLGLFKKEQTDYALAQDLYNVRVGVNGFQHVYRYASTRYKSFGEDTDENSAWDVGVKFQNNTGSYKRAIYKADYDYQDPEDPNNNDSDRNINVYVTYKISLKNEGSYIGRVNNIIGYCDSNYELQAAGYSINDEDEISDIITSYVIQKNSPNSEYNKYFIDTSQRIIDAGEEKSLYIQFKMNKTAISTIMSKGETKHNLAEINSYTTFDDDTGRPIAVYDKDSVPGTAIPDNFGTYEDDTDSARSLIITFPDPRSVEGTVFIDKTGKENQEAVAGAERKGDGIYQEGQEDTVKENQVEITMQEVDEQGNKKQNGLKYTTYTDNDGKFKISNFVAGYYQITYTWGDKEYPVQYYKGTIYKDKARSEKTQTDPYWYRGSEYENDTISVNDRRTDALDDKGIRTQIENEMRSVTINTLTQQIEDAYKEGYNSNGKVIKTTKMDSTTPTMAFSVEYDTVLTSGDAEHQFAVQNVDFGIVERAKQELEFRKRISGYKITLANGQVIVDTEIDENGNLKGVHEYTTYLKPSVQSGIINIGRLKTEIDNELIEGAILETIYEMKVTNIGELDYSTEDYYYYGIIGNDSEKVTVTVTELLDYVDGRLNNVDPYKQWTEVNMENRNNNHLIDVNASKKNDSDINEYRTYYTKDLAKELGKPNGVEKPLAPGQSNSIHLYTSKLLANTDNNTFNNEAEISQVEKNKTGFTIGTPVKLKNGYFNVGDSEEIEIVPSTGENKSIILPTIVGITAIVILGVGIFLIKKFVIE